MKPFNLKKAKAAEPVTTKNGCSVRILCFDRVDTVDPRYSIVALVKDNIRENVHFYDNNGVCLTYFPKGYYDLFMKPVKKTYHYCIYEYINNKDKSFVISQPWNDLEKLKTRYETSKKINVLEYRTIEVEVW